MLMQDLVIKANICGGEITYHIGNRSANQCTRCGCYDMDRTHLVRNPDKWDLQENGGPFPNDTTYVLSVHPKGGDPVPFAGTFDELIQKIADEEI